MSSNQARGRRSPPVYKTKRVIRRTDGHSSSVRLPSLAPYPSAGHSSADRVVRPYEPPALLTCLRLTRAFSLSTSRACHKVHVEDGTHRVDIRPTSGSRPRSSHRIPSLTAPFRASTLGTQPTPHSHRSISLHADSLAPLSSCRRVARCPVATSLLFIGQSSSVVLSCPSAITPSASLR